MAANFRAACFTACFSDDFQKSPLLLAFIFITGLPLEFSAIPFANNRSLASQRTASVTVQG